MTTAVVKDESVTLKRNYGILTGCSFVIGTTISSGIFISPQGVLIGAGSYGLSLIIWAVCGLLQLCTLLTYSEMACNIPKAGSTFNYLQVVYGDWLAHVYVFVFTFIISPGFSAALAQTSAEYFVLIFFNDGCGSSPGEIKQILASLIILLCAVINCTSALIGGKMAVVFAGAKLSVMVIIITGGIVKLSQGFSDNLNPEKSFDGTNRDFISISLAVSSAYFAFVGSEAVTRAVEELKQPKRDLPIISFISIPIVSTVLVLVNMSYFAVLSFQEVSQSISVAVTWARYVIPSVYWYVPLAVSILTFGNVLIGQLLVTRVVFASAREKHLPAIVSMLHINRFTPMPAVILMAALSTGFVYIASIAQLVQLVTSLLTVFNSCVGVALLILRYKHRNTKKSQDHYKAPLICPIIVIILGIVLFFGPLITNPQWSNFITLLVIAASLLSWLIFVKYSFRVPGIGLITKVLQLLLQVVASEEHLHTEIKESSRLTHRKYHSVSQSNYNTF